MIFDGDIVRAQGPEDLKYEINLAAIYRLESRRGEVTSVGLLTARELMFAMQEGMRLTGEALVNARLVVNRVNERLAWRRSEIVLIEVPNRFGDKVKTNEEQREAVMNGDKLYTELQDYAHQLAAIVALLTVKFKSFQDSYFTTQKVFDERIQGITLAPVQSVNQLPTPTPDTRIDLPFAATIPSVSIQGTTYPNNSNIEIGKARY